ncbi:MAG: hypothetical protein GY758_17060, partial [Fuerstiella sp.]|nr:hypothetical protein [Fuerstiella sp.]
MNRSNLFVAISLTITLPYLPAYAFADEVKAPQAKPVPLPAAAPQLVAVVPSGVQLGTSVEATVQGRSLLPVNRVTVDGRGVTAEIVPLPEGRKPSATSLTIKLTAAPDAEPGLHQLRLITPGGTSNIVRFAVGLLPQITEVEPNNDAADARPLSTLPLIINGALSRAEDRDVFRFSARKGQTIVMDLCGQQLHPYIDRLRPGWLEGVLTVRDASGIAPVADEYQAAQQLSAEKTAATTRAAAIAKKRRETAKKAATEKAAAAKQVTVITTAAKKATGLMKSTNAAADKAIVELKAARQKADEVAARENGDASGADADRIVAEKSKIAKKLRLAAADARAAADKTQAAQAAADKLLAGKTAAAKSAADRSSAAAAASKLAGEELTAARNHAGEMAAAVKKFDSSTIRSLASASHFPGRYDPALTFTAPHDGEYVVEVRDELYRGRSEFTYRLTIGELPFVTSAFPAGGRRGTTIPVRLTGYNLGDTTTVNVVTAAETPQNRQFERVTTSLGASNSIAFETGDPPELTEGEPNDDADRAVVAAVPATFNGVIERDGDFDCFKFEAKKGQRLIFETVSRSLGSPLDARLDLFDEKGRKLKSNDDANKMPDSLIEHTFAADGHYVIRIGDTTGRGSANHVYRLRVRSPRPDFSLTVNPDNPRVTAGGSIALTVMIRRLDGFKGDVEVTVPNPPPGTVVSPAVINGTQSQVVLTLTVPPDAEPAVVPLVIEGRTRIGEVEVTHRADPVERMRYINEWRYLPVHDLLLSVLPAAPFTLEWSQPSVTLVPGRNVQVAVRLHRTEGFTDAVRTTLQGLPSRTYAPVVTFEKDATEATVEIRSAGNAPAGTGNAVVNGTFRTFTQNSPALRV